MPETCAAIVIAAKHGELIKVRDYSGITDTVGALRCKFEFRTNDWDNATMTAVFCKGNMATNPEIVDGAIGVLLDSIDECAVPAEVLTRDAKYFSVGVWGVTTAGFRIVSKWLVFRIEDGCYVDATEPIEPTPTVFEQIMATLASKAPIEHEHNDIYYTKVEIDNMAITGNPGTGGGVAVETDPTVPSWAKQPNKPKYTASEVGALPASTKIPSTTSDLTNNSGFITKDVSDLTNYHKKSDVYTRTEIDNKKFLTEHQDLSSYAKKADVPTKTSDLENNSDFITRDETYSQAEIDNKLSLIPKFSISVVTKLPTTNISATTVYLLKDTTTNGNLYTEYIYVNGAWEMLGGQNVDLADYVKIEDIQDNINAALATAKASGEFKGDPFTYDDFTLEQLELLKGKDGSDGLSAYQIWLNAGNIGAESEFLVSLKGNDGDKGDSFTYEDFTPEQLEALKGTNGNDGVSVRSIEQTTTSTEDGGINVVTVTLSNDETFTFNVKNGGKGDTGADGTDGKTPTKGTDYFTETDKAELVNSVLAKLPKAEEDEF